MTNLDILTELAQSQAIELAKLKMELANVKAQLDTASRMKDAYKSEYKRYYDQFNK